MSESLLRLDEVKRRSGYSTSALYRAMAAGTFPRPRKRGTQSVWVESEVQDAIDRDVRELPVAQLGAPTRARKPKSRSEAA